MNAFLKRAVAPLLTSLLCVVSLLVSHAQTPNITPQSPNAAGLGKYGDIPVSYATGTARLVSSYSEVNVLLVSVFTHDTYYLLASPTPVSCYSSF